MPYSLIQQKIMSKHQAVYEKYTYWVVPFRKREDGGVEVLINLRSGESTVRKNGWFGVAGETVSYSVVKLEAVKRALKKELGFMFAEKELLFSAQVPNFAHVNEVYVVDVGARGRVDSISMNAQDARVQLHWEYEHGPAAALPRDHVWVQKSDRGWFGQFMECSYRKVVDAVFNQLERRGHGV
jgi:hypothetical protein